MIKNEEIIHDLDECAAFAYKLCEKIDIGYILLLDGDLGVGKSTLLRYIIRYFCGDIDVPSPSYSLIQEYQTIKPHKDFMIYHLDFYRLDSYDDALQLGIDDLINTGAVFVEWASQIPDYQWQKPYCHIMIKDNSNQHDTWRHMTTTIYDI